MEVDNNNIEEAGRVAGEIAGELVDIIFNDVIGDNETDTSDDSEDSDDDDDDDDDNDQDDVRERRHIHKIQNYVEHTIPLYDNETFQSHFRLQRPEVYRLIERYQQTNYLVNNEPNERAITHEKAFLLTLYYLANTETFREISDRFDLTMSSAHRVLQNTLDFIISLQDEYLVWPHNREDKREISQRFSAIQNIHGVIGAIDGCHIRIKRPMEQQRDYFNRKQFHSIVIQAVATSNNIITDVHIGEPGSMHDSRVLRRSPLYAAAHDNPDFFDGYFLLGDSAYANLPWLVPPFRDNGHLTDEEREFNYRHSSTRVRIEHTFGLLKCRFRRLNKFNNLLLDIVIRCTMASCILHNILTIARINNINIDDDSDDDNNNDNDDYNDNERVFVEDRRRYIFQNMFVDRE